MTEHRPTRTDSGHTARDAGSAGGSTPVSPHPFSMTVRTGLFAHWPFDPQKLRPHVPDPLELDTYDGHAWVSLVPFVLAGAGVRFTPRWARLTFGELNVRTYVRFDGSPGLYFFSVDVDHPIVPPVVQAVTRLPCYRADVHVRTRGDRVAFRSVRRRPGDPPASLDASYGPDGEVFRADPGTLDFWLTERRRMYDPCGSKVLYAEIAHDPWPLQPADATVHANATFEALGLPSPKGDPRVRYADGVPITGSIPRRIRGIAGPEHVRPPELAHH